MIDIEQDFMFASMWSLGIPISNATKPVVDIATGAIGLHAKIMYYQFPQILHETTAMIHERIL